MDRIGLIFRYHNGRKELARRAFQSLREQTFKEWDLYVSYETGADAIELGDLNQEFVGIITEYVKVNPQIEHGECFFNLYINEVKALIENRFILIYDSDSYFYLPDSLMKLSQILTSENEIYIIQFVRRGKVKPHDRQIDERIIKSGSVDSASIVFHSKHKDVAMFGGNDNSDFFFIKEMTQKLPTSYHKIRVIESDRRSRGV